MFLCASCFSKMQNWQNEIIRCYGRVAPMTDEHREKLRQVNTGKVFSEARRQAISASLSGKDYNYNVPYLTAAQLNERRKLLYRMVTGGDPSMAKRSQLLQNKEQN